MKKVKECDHCSARFRNRENLINHLISFHEIKGVINRMFEKPASGTIEPPAEGKPHRRIRMMMAAARAKKERDFVSRKGHNRGVQRAG